MLQATCLKNIYLDLTDSSVFPPVDAIEDASSLIETFSEEHQRVLQMYYGEGKTVDEIVKLEKSSTNRVHQLLREILSKFQTPKNMQMLTLAALESTLKECENNNK